MELGKLTRSDEFRNRFLYENGFEPVISLELTTSNSDAESLNDRLEQDRNSLSLLSF